MKAIIWEMREPIVTQQATERMIKIFDSKYKKENLKAIVARAKHLNQIEKDLLYKLLLKYEDIFDGLLREWKTEPVDFKMIDRAQPHCW